MPKKPPVETLFSGSSEMAARMRAFPWTNHRLGPVESWPQALRTAVSVCLHSRYPMVIWWGPELTLLYNDAYIPLLGPNKDRVALGSEGRQVWGEIWDVIGPMLAGVLERGDATWSDDRLLLVDRTGVIEEAYFTWSYSPIPVESGKICGVFTAVNETTEKVLFARHQHTLRELSSRAGHARTAEEAGCIALGAVGANRHDIPFAALYLADWAQNQARLVSTVALEPASGAVPTPLSLTAPESPWPLSSVLAAGHPVRLSLDTFPTPLPVGPWRVPCAEAVVLPVVSPGHEKPRGFLVAGINPRRPYDAAQEGFLISVAERIGNNLATATAYEEERRRSESLEQLDRAKTTFFSNVSHELRTPLTLMLGPLEEALTRHGEAMSGGELELVYRNGVRLMKLVNTILDFSRIEGGRIEASFTPTHLDAFTSELASVFRSAIEKAGLELRVECALDEPVFVDRDMWEKIVFNLLSNAFKFTLEGRIEVTLHKTGASAVLEVRDTGVGIPEAEIPKLFERFHRVKGARGRTIEGTGIGLALVSELVRLHGGALTVESREGEGSLFRVSLPLGSEHLPKDRIGESAERRARSRRANEFVDEAVRWLDDPGVAQLFGPAQAPVSGTARKTSARILVADDNADMRDYLTRLLGQTWQVEVVPNGRRALERAREGLFDLVLGDVMMPELDGFGLLRELRSDPRTALTPVVLLSARAGEEAILEGLHAGADDYLIKPFSARELLARIEGTLRLAEQRKLIRRRADQENRTLDNLSLLGRVLSAEWDSQKLVQTLTDVATELTGAQFGSFFYNDFKENGETYMLYTVSGAPRSAFDQFPMPRNTDLFGPTFRGEGIIRLDDVHRDPRYGKTAPHFGMPKGHLPVRSYLAAPVVSRSGKVLGGLFFGHSEVAQFSERSERLLATLASQAAIAIDNAQLFRERSQALTFLKQSLTELERSNAELARFAYIASHDLKEPLRVISNYVQLLERSNLGLLDEKSRLYMQFIVDASRRMSALINDLLAFSRLGTTPDALEPLELASVMDETLSNLETSIREANATITVEALPKVVADRSQMIQLFQNLLSNAIKYRKADTRPEVRISAARDENGWRLCVKDNGIGIAQEYFEKIFVLFQRLHGSGAYSGTGLGLAICRKIVERHGGKIWVESTAGKGSEFLFTFPDALPTQTAVHGASDRRAEASQ